MKQPKTSLLYSEPIREIMGTPPGRLVRAGTIVIFLLFLLFILFAWILKYPDTIPSQVEITTTNPPVTIVSKITGHIKQLYIEDKDSVVPGQLIGVMETTASVKDINDLRIILDTMTIGQSEVLPEFTNLGELQEYYATWRKNHSNLTSFDRNDFYGNRILSVKNEIEGIQEYLRRLRTKENLYAENLKIEKGKYYRDSMLCAGKIIPESQLEVSHQALLKSSLDHQQVRIEQAAKLIELSVKQQMLQDYIITRSDERARLLSVLEESFLNLKAQMQIWVNTYFLISDIEGTATFTRFWSENQTVSKDEPVLSIVPREAGDFIGRMKLKMQRSGKVMEGQMVNIKLSGYPYLEYGMVRGIIKSKSLVPAGDEYIIEIELPYGLKTLYGISLGFDQNMQGIAEIITEDVRLLQKLINPFRHLIARNKQ